MRYSVLVDAPSVPVYRHDSGSGSYRPADWIIVVSVRICDLKAGFAFNVCVFSVFHIRAARRTLLEEVRDISHRENSDQCPLQETHHHVTPVVFVVRHACVSHINGKGHQEELNCGPEETSPFGCQTCLDIKLHRTTTDDTTFTGDMGNSTNVIKTKQTDFLSSHC